LLGLSLLAALGSAPRRAAPRRRVNGLLPAGDTNRRSQTREQWYYSKQNFEWQTAV